MEMHFSINNNFHLSIKNIDNSTNIYKRNQNDNIKKSELGSQLKNNDPIKELMDQKNKISENRQKYLDNALKKNESPDTIKDKLAEYDKQISEIDKQISEIRIDEQKKKLEGDKDDKNNNKAGYNSRQTSNDKESSSESDDSNMLNDLVQLSSNLSSTKIIKNLNQTNIHNKIMIKTDIDDDKRLNINPASDMKALDKLEDAMSKSDKIFSDKIKEINDTDNKENNSKLNINSSDSTKSYLDYNDTNSKFQNAIGIYNEHKDIAKQTDGEKLNSIA